MKRFLIIGLGLVFLASCNPQKTEQRGSDQTDQDNDGVWELPNYTYTDSLMQGSHKVVFTITSHQLLIMKDGKQLFNRSFTKADFKSQLPGDFQKYGLMDGLRFNHAEEGKLYFNTCVSFPDSDMSCPFFLIIGPDGSYRIEPNNTLDEDDLPPAPDQMEEQGDA